METPRLEPSRADFLRTSLGGVAGLGLAGPAAASAGAADPRRGYVVTVTHGPSDPNRVMLALFTATRLPAGDNHLWFAIDGGELCRRGEADKVTSPLFTKQGSAARLVDQARARGVALHI